MASRGINKVILVGYLGQDPEVRYMPNGGAITNIVLATSENWRDKQTGEIKEKTEWHRIVLFGRIAEVAGEYLHKGTQVYIEGSLHTRKWQDQAGQDRYTTEVIVSVGGTMQMLGNRFNDSATNINLENNLEHNHKIPTSRDNTNFKNEDSSKVYSIQNEKAGSCNESSIDFDDDIPF